MCMERYRYLKFLLILLISFSLFGCPGKRAIDPEQMMVLGSALTKLSAATESAVRYKNPPEDLNDWDLIVFATQHDASLRAPFEDYAVRVKKENRHAILLVCSKDRQQALLEDSNCTAKLDKHLWEGEPVKPCEFTVSPLEVCGGN